MTNFSERYKACKESVKELALQTPHRLWIALMSIGLSVLLMVGPIVIFVNCFIFNDYMGLCLIGILVCVFFIIFLSRVFYYKTITQKQVPDMSCFYAVDALVCALAMFVGIFIGLFI